ncbi:tetratricopeptide repeat protein [Actinoallomurus sp. NBC_01490]|uniref:tetratricopeptide repeat protein n=1 Tax=Actinoallomurus sp. NBC_01490 TaxID=2903557 RepID=UPI002E32971B|nr:tetratricopeptide repeat protein [Actinoallomurus sp. NBC_01490]
MTSWAERLQTATDRWRQGDLEGATVLLREVVVSGDHTIVPEASHALGRLLEERGDPGGAQAAHRSVIATGHPVFAQRSAICLGLMLTGDEQWALAHRPLLTAASGADSEIAAMAEVSLVRVLRRLGDLDASAEALERARRSGVPAVAELAEELETARWPDDGGERERQAWQAYEAIAHLLDDDEGEADHEVVLAGLNMMLSHGIPELCSQAAFRLYSIYAERGEFDECRRVMEHAIAVGDPAERGMAEKLLGAALFDLGEHLEAREAYRRAADDHRPEVRLDALIQESKFARELGDEEESRAILWRVVESGHPRFALEARACLGQVYSEAGEVDDAVACWRVVLETGSEFHQGAVHFLGMLLHGLPAADPRRAEIVALLRRAAEFDDPDVAFQAQMTLTQADMAARGPDERREQAVDDCDAALERLREGDPVRARTLLRTVIDAEIEGVSARAARTLALLELGEGDPEQAEELLEHIADSGAFTDGFAAAVDRHLIVSGEGGAPHPVLSAWVDYQRLGRDAGIARLQECAGHPDLAVAALAKSTLAQAYVYLGVPRSRGVELLNEAAAAGDPLALSHAAALSWIIRPDDEVDEVIELLRRAHAHGDPALAPWVAHALGSALQGRGQEGDADEALAAYEAVSGSGHPDLGIEAETKMIEILEEREDLAGAATVHERIVARGDRLQAPRSAWLLGLTRVRLDDFDAARAAYASIPEDHPELAEHGRFARRLLDRDFEGAAADLATVREHADDPDDVRMIVATWLAVEAAHAWQRAGDTTATDAALSLAVAEGHPAKAQEAALFLGALRDDAGDHAGAAEAWARAADGDNEHLAKVGAEALGEALHRLGDLDGAAAAYRQALEATEPDDDAHGRLLDTVIHLLVAAGRAAEARALQIDKTGEGSHVGLLIGKALEANGDLDAAAAYYRESIEDEDGGELEAAYSCVMLARLLAGRGEVTQAAAMAERAIASFGRLAEAGVEHAEGSLASTAYELGGYLSEAGDAEGAREAYERATAAEDPLVRVSAKERLGAASLRERALLRLHEGDRTAALDLFTREYGSPVIAEVHIALFDGRFEALRPLLEQAAGTEHAERAANFVLTAALEKLREGPDEAAGLCAMVQEFGTPEQVAVVCDNLAHAYDLAGDIDAAVDVLKRGAAVDHPFALSCLRRLIGLLALQGDHTAADEAARRAIDSGDPETVTIGVWTLGDLAKARGDLAEAAARYRTAIEGADPATVPSIQVELGRVLWELGESGAAYRVMESVLTGDDPGRALFAGTHMGFWLAEDGRLADAAEAFGAAVAAGVRHPDPDEDDQECHQRALNALASVAGEADGAGDAAAAVRALHLAAAGGASNDAARIAEDYATVAVERGDLDAARTYYEGAAAFPPDGDPRLLVKLAELLAEHGAAAEARALLERLVASDDPYVRLAAGVTLVPMLEEAGEHDRALEVAARSAGQDVSREAAEAPADTALDPNAQALLGSLLGVMQRERGDSEGSLRTLRAAAESGEPAALLTLGETLVEAGRVEEAREVLTDACETEGEFGRRAVVGLGRTFHDEDPDRARELYLRAVRTAAGSDSVATVLAKMYLGSLAKRDRDWPEALRWYQQVIDSGGRTGDTSQAPMAAAHLGELAYWLGDRDAAVRFYELTLATGTENAELVGEASYRLGEIRHGDGHTEPARRHLRQAIGSGHAGFADQARALLDKLGEED